MFVLLLLIVAAAIVAALVNAAARRAAPPRWRPPDEDAAGPPLHLVDERRWMVDTTRYFRRMGFFAEHVRASDERLAAELARRIRYEWGAAVGELTDDPQAADMFLLSLDVDRVYRPSMKYCYPGENTYAEIVRQCARLDPATFAVHHVRERWDSERGPIHVFFSVADRDYQFTTDDDQYFDAAIVLLLNRAVAPAPVQLKVCDTHGMPDFVVALSDAESTTLATDRGWTFWDDAVPA